MDPNTAFDALVNGILNDHWYSAFQAADDLREWLEKDGFYPTVHPENIHSIIDALIKATLKATTQNE